MIRINNVTPTDSKHQRLVLGQLMYVLTAFAFLFLMGCEKIPNGDESNSVSANWDEDSSTLKITGMASGDQSSVEIHDAADGSLLGLAVVMADGSWAATGSTPACNIHVSLSSVKSTFAVENAPSNCTGSASYAREKLNGGKILTAEDIPSTVFVESNPVLSATVPNAVILNPPQNLTINAGQVIKFEGVAVGTGVSPPYRYYWNFGGAAPNSPIQNPGYVRFDTPGTYFIQLSATDSLGVPDPTPAIRTITVNNANSPFGLTPTPTITAPVPVNGVVSISVGDAVFFAGSAVDSLTSSRFTFEWSFSGVQPTQFGSSIGSVSFYREGSYQVSLYATNSSGIRSAFPATVTVVVSSASGVNQAPTGIITQPVNNTTIDAGTRLSFSARGFDTDNSLPLYYSWDFQGAATDIRLSGEQRAGFVTFNNPGVYRIRMIVTDSQGLADPNPPVRVITVRDVTPPSSDVVLLPQITSPPNDVNIRPGQIVFFSGQVISSANTGPLTYFWNFGGAPVNSNLLTPGGVTFPIPGQYFVTFYAINSAGNVVGTSNSRTITVRDPSNVEAHILSPLDANVVSAGAKIELIGATHNSSTLSRLNYFWSIKQRGEANTIFTSTILSPGSFIFINPGDYIVTFTVDGLDSLGNRTIASIAKSRITVTASRPPVPNPGVTNLSMKYPSSDKIIYVGETVRFEAHTIVGQNITYGWNFDGVAPRSTSKIPTPITYLNPGVYFVTLRISGTVGGNPLNLYSQRVITVLRQNPAFPPVPIPNTAGNGILLPALDQVIHVGDTLDFKADIVAGANVKYSWFFDGARAPSSWRQPPPVIFKTAGTFLITLLISGDNNGRSINIYDQRRITVLPLSAPIPIDTTPIPLGSGIISPATDRVVRIGDYVDFEALNIPGAFLTYQWNFGAAAPPIRLRNPPPIQLNLAGSYLVSLKITGTLNGVPVTGFDQRVITVIGPDPVPMPVPIWPPGSVTNPQGYIISPTETIVALRVGETVRFAANGFDPIGAGALSYEWSFGGARRNIAAQNPGIITFNVVGTYVVSLIVKNAIGQYDTTPPSIVISVTP